MTKVPRTGPRKRVLAPKVSKEAVKAAAARAEARSAGEEPETTKAPINPRIIPASLLVDAETHKARVEEAERRKLAAKARIVAKRRQRRSRYSEPLGKAIARMLAMGHTLSAICRRPLMPSEALVLKWALDPKHPFGERYARGREMFYGRMVDEIIELADDSVSDWTLKEGKDGRDRRVPDREHLDRVKLRIETRKWVLAKMLPKQFGDKAQVPAADAPAEALEDRPQPTGQDHMAEITQRFAAHVPANTGKVAPSKGPAKGPMH